MPIFTGRIKRESVSIVLTHGAGATTANVTDVLNGILRQINITPPAAVDGSATVQVTLADYDGVIVYTKTGIAANTPSLNLLTNDLRVPLSGNYTITVTFSAVQTTVDRTTKVVMYIET